MDTIQFCVYLDKKNSWKEGKTKNIIRIDYFLGVRKWFLFMMKKERNFI